MTDKQYKTSRMQIESMRVWIKDLTIIDGVSLLGVVAVGIYLGTLLHPFINGEKYVSFAEFLGGFLGVVGILLLSKRTYNQDKQLGYQQKQIQIQVDKEIDDRFTSAITLLGSDQTSARTGALYVLYKLAISTENYRKEIVQIMCAHIRVHTQTQKYQRDNPNQPSDEIKTALYLLFKDHNNYEGLYRKYNVSELPKADLSFSYLCGGVLAGAQLQLADLSHSNLSNVDLTFAWCQHTKFHSAVCFKTNFNVSRCQSAEFFHAKCTDTTFRNAALQNSKFTQAQCQKTDFTKAQCQGADFRMKDCQEVIFNEAKCLGAIFILNLVQNSCFYDTKCQGALFYKTDIDTGLGTDHFPLFTNRIEVGQNSELMIFNSKISKFELVDTLDNIIKFRDKYSNILIPKGMITGVIEEAEELKRIQADLEYWEKLSSQHSPTLSFNEMFPNISKAYDKT